MREYVCVIYVNTYTTVFLNQITSIEMKSWGSTFKFEMKQRVWGLPRSPCKTVLWPLEGLQRLSHTSNFKSFAGN
jgi:hypothetical protein